MKRVIAIIAVLISIMCFAYAYRLRTLGMIQTDVVAISDRNLAKNLQKGADGDEEPDAVILEKFNAGDTVYQRGNNLYIGENKDRVQSDYPFYMGDGTGIWYFQATGSLITDDFMEYEPYAGLYVSDGTAFDEDGVGKDDDTYIFAKLGNGLYMNTVPVTVRSNGVDHDLRLGSLISFKEDMVSSYVYAGERLEYDKCDHLYDAKIIIRDKTYDYNSFLRQLGVIKDSKEVSAKSDETEETTAPANIDDGEKQRRSGAVTSKSINSLENSENSSDGNDTSGSAKEDADSRFEDTLEGAENGEIAYTEEGKDTGVSDSLADSGSGFSGSSSIGMDFGGGGMGGSGSAGAGAGASAGSGSGSGGSAGGSSGGDSAGKENGGNGNSGNGSNQSGSGNSSGSGSGNTTGNTTGNDSSSGDATGTDTDGGNTDNDGSGGGDNNNTHGNSDSSGDGSGGSGGNSGDVAVTKPVISLTNLSADVYNVYGELSVNDPDKRLHRVVIRVYLEENGEEKELITRKNFKTSGSITIPNVRPDTSILVQGTYVWKNKDGVKETESFMEDVPLHTLSLDHLAPLTFTSEKATKFYSDRIQIPNMQTSSDRPSDLSYIAKGILEIRKKGETGLATDEALTLAGSDIRNLRLGQKTTWISDGILKSGTEYEWKLTLKDRFDNVLPYTSSSKFEGSTRTSYKAPAASISMVGNSVGNQQIRITIINEDSRYVNLRDGYMVLCDPQTGARLSVFDQVGDDPETKIKRKLNLNQGTIIEMLSDLPSGRNYRVEIYGTYDLKDTDPETATVDARLGQTSIYTAAISNLGTASYDISVSDVTASSANVEFHISSYTYDMLIQLMTSIKLTVSAPVNGSREIILNKAEWENINISSLPKDGNSYVLYTADEYDGTPEVLLNYLGSEADSTSVWTAISEFTSVQVRYPNGKFSSKTQYSAKIETTVTQANEEYDVSSSSSVIQFKTNRKAPTVNCSELLVISNFAELYGFSVDDPDGTITNGQVNLRLYAGERLVYSSFVETNRTYSADNEGEEDLMSFHNLISTNYTIRVYATEYNEGYDSSEKIDNYAFPQDSWLKFTIGSGITGKVELRTLEEPIDEKQDATIRVTLKDPSGDLLKVSENPTYMLEYRKVEGRDVSDEEIDQTSLIGGKPEVKKLTVVDGKIQDLSEDITFKTDLFCTYDIRLVIEIRGHRVTLGSTNFETGEKIYTITQESDFNQMKEHTEAKFIVLNDITMTKGYSIGSNTDMFNGQLDFQGYTLTANFKGGSRLFQYIGSRGIVENMEFYYNNTVSQTIGDGAPICWRNYGTIRNVIEHINIKGRTQIYLGGLVFNNYASAVIENFAVEISSNGMYVKGNSGCVAYSNTGIIRNGYVYGGNIIVGSGIYGGDSTGSRTNVGGIVGTNAGLVYNCFTLNQIQIEKGTNMHTVGLAVGYNSGRVQNVLSVGDIFVYEYDEYKTQTTPEPLLDYGGTVGYGGGTIKDVYLLSEGNYTYGKNGGAAYKKAKAIESRTLRSSSWHQNCFNSEGAFEVENMVQAGYYPRLLLPDELMSKQDTIGLPLVGISAYPDIISSTVLEEGRDDKGNDYALVDLEFYNANDYQITGLDVVGLTAEIQDGQGATESTYHVTVKLTNPQLYRSNYTVSRVYYRGTGTTINKYDYTGRTVLVSFYKPVSTVNDWKSIAEDLAGNYRVESDIDFSAAYSSDMRIKGKFTGTLDGKDLDGTLHTLKNMQEIQNGSVFENVDGGTIKNLTVEGLKLESTSPSEGLRTGFVGTAGNFATLDHVFIVGSDDRNEVSVYGYGGALVGEVNNATVTNCGVRDMALTSKEIKKNTLYLGGLAGSISAAQLNNCYAQQVTITADAGYAAYGIGGLIGAQGSGSSMSALYAQGSIKTSFQNAGGIVGSVGSAISKALSYVDINSISDNLGGIAGRLVGSVSIQNVLEMGNIYTTSSNTGDSGTVRRIVGLVGNYTYTARDTVGYSGQLLGKETVEGAMMSANICVSLSELWTKKPYRDYAVLGSNFDISGMKSGGEYTAENGILPMLLDTDGELLPNQEPVTLPDPSLELEVTGIYDETTGKYGMIMEVKGMYDTEQKKYLYNPTEVQVPGMTFADIINGVDSGKVDIKIDQYGTVSYTWSEVDIQSYIDSYQVTLTLKKTEGGTVQVLKASLQFSQPVYHEIYNTQEFIDAMNTYGQNYENFRINADINLSGYNNLPMNLKLNHLVGRNNQYTISGITYQVESQGQSFIQVLSGTMENIRWKDIMITSNASKVSGGSNVGLISMNNGEIKNSSFENISITAPTSSQRTGLIGTSAGRISNVTLKDIRINATASYIGGLCGYVSGTIDGVSAYGTLNGSNYQYSINGGEIKSNGTQYVGGLIGYLAGEAQHLSAEGVEVNGSLYVGGLIGSTNDPSGVRKYYGFRVGVRTVTSDADTGDSTDSDDTTEIRGARTGTNRDADGKEIIRNKVKGYRYVGGMFGNSGQSEDSCYYSEVYNTDVSANSYAGGYAGNTGWVYPKYIVCEDLTVTAIGNFVGGAYGCYGAGDHILVNHVTVSGSNYTSGVYGNYSHTNTKNIMLENSKISGADYVSGYEGYRIYNIAYYNIGVYNCSITASGSYAGGIFAYVEPNTIYRCYVSHTDVEAESCAGGLAGEIRCGRVVGCEIGANVKASQAAGGLAGRMYSYYYRYTSPSSYPATYVYKNIIAGTVKATATLAGGIAGELVPGDDRLDGDGTVVTVAPTDMTEEKFYYNILALTSISSGDTRRGFIEYNTGLAMADSGKLKGSYIWEGTELGLVNSADSTITPVMKAGKSTILTPNTGVKTITTADMQIPRSKGSTSPYYYVTNDTSYWDDSGPASGYLPYSKATDSLEIKIGDTQSINGLSMKQIGAGIPIPQDNAAALAMIDAELPTMEVYASGVDTINLEFDRDVTKDAESGLTMRPVVDAESEDEAVDESAEAESESDGQTAGTAVQGSDSRTAKAVAVAGADGEAAAQNDAVDTEDTDTLYDTDAAFAYGDMAAAVPEYRVRILSGGEVLADEAITGRVMTFSYDYQTPLTAEVTDGFNSEQYEIAPETLAHSVMVYGDSWYYLTAGGVGTPDGVVAGEYIHLFNGSALDLDGNIKDLGGGSGKLEENAVLVATTPLYEWDYAGYDLMVFKNFTLSLDEADAMSLMSEMDVDAGDETDALSLMDDAYGLYDTYEVSEDAFSEVPYQAIVKNGEMSLFNAENPVSSDGWIIDSYQDESFMTVLGSDGKLADIGQDEIKLPEDFQNSYIGEISNTAYADSPIVVGRYNSGKVFAFNYLTGESLEVVQSDEDLIDLIDYAKQWISDKSDSMLKGARSSYLATQTLSKQVDLNEIKNLYDEINGKETQNSIAEALRGNEKAGDGGDSGQSDSGIRSNDLAETEKVHPTAPVRQIHFRPKKSELVEIRQVQIQVLIKMASRV